MSVNVTNQKPAVFSPIHTASVKGDFDPLRGISKTIAKPMFEPINATHTASITDSQGNDITKDDVTNVVLEICRDLVNPQAEDMFRELLQPTSIYFDHRFQLPGSEFFVAQAGARLKMHPPSPRVMYSAKGDVIPAAKNMLAGNNADGDELMASLAFAYNPKTLGFYFLTETDFEDFKAWLDPQVAALSQLMDPSVIKIFSDFQALKLDTLTESITLRKDDDDGNEEYSFARVLTYMLMDYTNQVGTDVYGPMAFSLGELFVPLNVVFVNVERHARARSSRVSAEWAMIKQSLTSPIRTVSQKQINKLTSAHRNAQKAAAMAASAQSNKLAQTTKMAKIKFRHTAPPPDTLARDIIRVLKRMQRVNISMNPITNITRTFSKANRRHPDDPNVPGKSVKKSYMPDIHVYADTSGSISEDNYQTIVKMVIMMAKKMNVDVYFSSFSHVLSKETKLRIKDRSMKQIWHDFVKIHKVQGGTDYEQIWHYIQSSKPRRQRLNVVITDFEWWPRQGRFDHPKNLYYAPIQGANWPTIIDSAKRFASSMRLISPGIHRRFLGMVD